MRLVTLAIKDLNENTLKYTGEVGNTKDSDWEHIRTWTAEGFIIHMILRNILRKK